MRVGGRYAAYARHSDKAVFRETAGMSIVGFDLA